ncbi:hypothetical protein [Jejuia pallidilutea]|nr:hypothetical protein [Jejuia pallidilutea]GAL73415.1 hypothetical protein JCM19302_3194 [Jejuia pallidilutea]
MGKWNTKFYLSNGLISVRENYWKNKLRSRTEFEYDRFGNVVREINTYNINDGNVNSIDTIKLEYKDSLLIGRVFSYGYEKYSDFTELGKPKLIEKKDEVLLKAFSKEKIEYDEKGNIIKSTEFTDYKDSPVSPKPENEKCIITYKYDDRNNVVEIHREYEPKQEFPIPITGGPFLYEYEYFRYKYNKNGLWTKKYKTVNGKEYLIAKRKYK